MSDAANERLEEQWKRWAERPPVTPAGVATQRLVVRLEEEERRKAFRPRRWAAVAAAAAATVLAVVLAFHEPSLPPAAATERPPLKDGVVLLWLDSETPLYLTLRKGDPT